MELRDYLAIVGRRLWTFVIAVVVVVAVFIGYAVTRPASFKAVATASFVKSSEAASTTNPQYRYDAYYALGSNELLAKLASGWLAEPNVAADIYAKADVALPGGDITHYGQLIDTHTLSGASLEIITKAGSADEAKSLASAATSFLTDRASQLQKMNNLGGISVLTTEPLSQSVVTSLGLMGVVGVIVGIILGLILVFFVEYLKPSTHK